MCSWLYLYTYYLMIHFNFIIYELFFCSCFCMLIMECAVAVNRLLEYKYRMKILIRIPICQCNESTDKIQKAGPKEQR